MATLQRAIEIAVTAHSGQVDKAGAVYILHPLRLMLQMDTEPEMIVAVLHDLIEDTPWTLDALRAEGFSDKILEAIDNVSKREGEEYNDYLSRVERSPISLRVKVADLEDNLDLKRLDKITDKDLKRMKKYLRAWSAFKGV